MGVGLGSAPMTVWLIPLMALQMASAAPRSPDGLDRTLTIQNRTGLEMRSLIAADERTGQFNENLLGTAPLASGQGRRLNLDTGNGVCLFTLQMQLVSGETLTRSGINACRLDELTITR